MESDDLKPNPPEDTPLETWLRASAARPPLPDDGFSQRVLAALPPPQRRSRTSPRRRAIGLGALIGAGFAAVAFSVRPPAEFTQSLTPTDEVANAFALLADPKVHIALGVTVVALAYAFWPEVRRRLGL